MASLDSSQSSLDELTDDRENIHSQKGCCSSRMTAIDQKGKQAGTNHKANSTNDLASLSMHKSAAVGLAAFPDDLKLSFWIEGLISDGGGKR